MEPTRNVSFHGESATSLSSVFFRLLFVLLAASALFMTQTAEAQISFQAELTQTACPNSPSGEITVSMVSGGSGNYEYSKDNGMTYQASPIFTGLDTGYYYIRVRDDAMPPLVSDSIPVYTDSPPNARCQQMTVALTQYGMAVVPADDFDDGSDDDCNPPRLWFRVSRMTASATCIDPENPNNFFDDSLKVCCDDIIGKDSIIVRFRVYDRDPGRLPIPEDTLMEHFGECMVTLRILDNVPPDVLSCASDVTIDCHDDITDLSRFGFPDVRENCTIVDTMYTRVDSLGSCRTGKITQKWVFTDQGGLKDSCTHTITIENMDPFNGLDTNQLKWPVNFTLYDCNPQNVHPDTTGWPIALDDACSQVTMDWDDDVYTFAPDACIKIRRHWTVIDWCQYTRGLMRTPANGVWTYTQEIKILDTVPPVLTGPQDFEALSYANDCGPIHVDVPPVTAMDCADSADMAYYYKLDLFSDGIIDDTLPGNNASGIYPIGDHTITFVVDDKCNNQSKWVTQLSVVDAKPPSLVMINKLIVPLMNMGNGGMAVVNAKQFDVKSTDNCTPSDQLRFSFTPVVTDTVKTFNCDTIGPIPVQIWVTDLQGNKSVINNCVIIQDNDTICPMTSTSQLIGSLTTIGGHPVSGVEVNMQGSNLLETVVSDNSGLFEFSRINADRNVEVTPMANEDGWLEGITTKDLILIQQHLLGTGLFSDPRQFIAADVDRSGSVSTRDIISLRKLILGLEQRVPGNTSWRYLDAAYQFRDPSDPLKETFAESCQLQSNSGIHPVSFTAIKVGDLSGDAGYRESELESRNGSVTWDWRWLQRTEGETFIAKAQSGSAQVIAGFQIEILSPMFQPGLLLSVNAGKGLEEAGLYWTYTANGIRIVYTPKAQVYVDADEDLLEFVWSDQIMINDLQFTVGDAIHPEFYDLQLRTGSISFSQVEVADMDLSIAPNPSQGSTRLILEKGTAGVYRVDVYGVSGYRMLSRSYDIGSRGRLNEEITLPGYAPEGLYLIRVTDPTGSIRTLKWHRMP